MAFLPRSHLTAEGRRQRRATKRLMFTEMGSPFGRAKLRIFSSPALAASKIRRPSSSCCSAGAMDDLRDADLRALLDMGSAGPLGYRTRALRSLLAS